MKHALTASPSVEPRAIVTSRLLAALAAFLCLLGNGSNSWAQRLFTVETGFDDSALAEVDKATGAILNVYQVQQGLLIGGLAYDHSSNTLFAAGTYALGNGRQGALYTVNTTTGGFSLVGDAEPWISGLAVQPGTFQLYGATFEGDLYTVNKATGAATLVGSDHDDLDFVHGLDFSPSGVLYAADTGGAATSKLFTINPSTGDATFVATIDRDYVVGLAFDAGGALYGSDNSTSSLITIDTLSGGATTVGPYGSTGGHSSLAFVPEPGTWAMIVGAGLIGLAARARRRRKR
jgi:hypothetical protein